MAAYDESAVPDQRGRVVLVTGANTGLGFEVARVLAGRGAELWLACRSEERGREARRSILEQHPDAEVTWLRLDLADLDSVREAAATVADGAPLDLLVNNAGIMVPPREETVDGFESQFGVNHLGHFALTGLLLPRLRAAGAARVVTVSSSAHWAGRIDFEDLQATRSYSRQGRYSMSKLANLLFTRELNARLSAAGADTIAVASHPGVSETELVRHLPSWALLASPLVRLFAHDPPRAALTTLLAATGAGVRGGDYVGPQGPFGMSGPPGRAASSPRSRDDAVARRLWEISIELTGVDPALPPA